MIPWFLGVPSSANIADFPSRQTAHPFLTNEKCIDDGITKARLDEVMCRFHDSPPLKGGGLHGLNAVVECHLRQIMEQKGIYKCA